MACRPSDVARALGADPSLVTRWVRRGMPLDSLQAALDWHAAHVRSRVRVVGAAEDRPSAQAPRQDVAGEAVIAGSARAELLEARLRRERAEAAMAELREREATGELVRADAVRAAHARRLSALRESLLQLVPRLAPVLAAAGDQAQCHEALERAIHDVLRQASAA